MHIRHAQTPCFHLQIPWAIIETALYVLIAYFFVGYYHGAGYFFIFYILCLLGVDFGLTFTSHLTIPF